MENTINSETMKVSTKPKNVLRQLTLTKWRLCFFKVRNMWIGHIILIHSNPLGVKSSWRIDASLMLCQTCAFYLVTRQPRCFISTAKPAGNVLLQYFVGDFRSYWLKCFYSSWVKFHNYIY